MKRPPKLSIERLIQIEQELNALNDEVAFRRAEVLICVQRLKEVLERLSELNNRGVIYPSRKNDNPT